jgi:hypothetical protein
MHDDYLLDWNKAMASGDNTSSLERLITEDYYVTFFQGNQEKPSTYNKSDSVTGMQHSVKELSGAIKKFDKRIIRLRDTSNALVFYELLIEKDGKVLVRLFTIENWKNNKQKSGC